MKSAVVKVCLEFEANLKQAYPEDRYHAKVLNIQAHFGLRQVGKAGKSARLNSAVKRGQMAQKNHPSSYEYRSLNTNAIIFFLLVSNGDRKQKKIRIF